MKNDASERARIIFLDTEVFVQQNFQYDQGLLEAFRQHVKAGRLRHVTTDVTVKEMRSKLAVAVESARVALKRFQSDARVLRNLPSTSVAPVFKTWNRKKVIRDLSAQLDAFLEDINSTVVETDRIQPSTVFARYFGAKPPFSDSKKKAEFPDAFAMEALLSFVREEGCRITVVSGDRDWEAFAESEQQIDLATRIDEVLQSVQADSPLMAMAVDILNALEPDVQEQVLETSAGLGFYVADRDATVVDVSPRNAYIGHKCLANVTNDTILFSADVTINFDVFVDYADVVRPDHPSPWDLGGYRRLRSVFDTDDRHLWASESFRILGTIEWDSSLPEHRSVSSVAIVDPHPIAVFSREYGST